MDPTKNTKGAKEANLGRPVDNLEEKWSLVPSFLKTKGVFNQHIASFNYLVESDMR